MATKPDGSAARTERVTFTKPAAERIAKVVRAVEGGDRDAGPLTFGARIGGASGKVFRICTYTGAWSIGDAKAVTFKYATATPNTVSATNLFFPVTNTATTSARDCAIAKDGTAWFLIDVKLAERTAVFVGSTATIVAVASTASAIVASSTQSTALLTDVTLSASLNTSNCTITIGKTLVTASTILVTGTVTATVIGSTATAIAVASTFTSTYLTLEV
jgi:hypothetical protein